MRYGGIALFVAGIAIIFLLFLTHQVTATSCTTHADCSQTCNVKCPTNVYGCCSGCSVGQCVKGTCQCITAKSYCSGSPNYQVDGLCARPNGICSNYCEVGTPPGPGCDTSEVIPSAPTTCHATQDFYTDFAIGHGFYATPTLVNVGSIATANAVNNYNIDHGPWLLSCPESPSGFSAYMSQNYFYEYPSTRKYPFIGGDACLSDGGSLHTTVDLQTNIDAGAQNKDGLGGFYEASFSSSPLSLSGFGYMPINNFAYTPMVDITGANVIASDFSSNTNVFDQIPSSAQHGIWTWQVKFVNFQGLNPDTFTVTATPKMTLTYPIPVADDNDDLNNGGSFAGARERSQQTSKTSFSQPSATNHNSIAYTGTDASRGPLDVSKKAEQNNASFSNSGQTTKSVSFSGVGPPCPSVGGFPNCYLSSGPDSCALNCNGDCQSSGYSSGRCSTSYSCSGTLICCVCSGAVSTTSTSTTSSTSRSSTSTTSTSTTSTSASSTSTSTTSTSTSTSTTIEKYSCTYTYNYQEVTKLKSIGNGFIPFNEVVLDPVSEGVTQYASFDANVVPYLTYNFILPAPDNQYLFNSYDVFSPWLYNSLSKTGVGVRDPFPMIIGSQLYFDYNAPTSTYPAGNVLVFAASNEIYTQPKFTEELSDIDDEVTLLPTRKPQQQIANSNFGLKHANLDNPMSIAALPNDYIFVLNYSTSGCAETPPCYYLNVLRMMPKGNYNASGYEPSNPAVIPPVQSDISQQATDLQQWRQNWNNYWANVIDVQGSTTYNINSVPLSDILQNANLLSNIQNAKDCANCPSGGSVNGFSLRNISVADDGDVFITGNLSTTGCGFWSCGNTNYPMMVRMHFPSIGTVVDYSATPTLAANTTASWSFNSKVPVLDEIATTPTGVITFGANQSSGNIYQFSGNDLSQTGSESLEFQTGAGASRQAVLNIVYWLQNGGLYGEYFDGVGGTDHAFGIYLPNTDESTWMDNASYHHPVGITEVNGYLYVLDDWQGGVGVRHDCGGGFYFVVGCTNHYPGTYFNMLVLRVLNSSGASVPLNPTNFNDVFVQGTCGSPTSTPSSPCQLLKGSTNCFSCNPSGSLPDCAAGCTASGAGSCKAGPNDGETYQCFASSGVTQSTTYYSLATGTYGQKTYPPYGWILSANVTSLYDLIQYQYAYSGTNYYSPPYDPNSDSPSKTNIIAHLTFCSAPNNVYDGGSTADCWGTPHHMPSDYKGGYLPIGPALKALRVDSLGGAWRPYWHSSSVVGASFTQYMNGAGFSVNFNQTGTMVFPGYYTSGSRCVALYGCSTYNPNVYNETIIAKVNIENYTKPFSGYQPYSCYVDSSPDSGAQPTYCGFIATAEFSEILPPIYLVADPFKYVENLGTAQPLTLAGQFSSSFPSGTSGGSSDAGPPSLTIQPSSLNWGSPGTIQSTASSSGNSLEIDIKGSGPTISATGIGSASYSICEQSPSFTNPSGTDCLSPDSYTVSATETGTDGSTTFGPVSNTITINPAPYIDLTSTSINAGTPDAANAIAYTSTDSVSISLIDPNGATIATASGTGTATIQICPNPGVPDVTCFPSLQVLGGPTSALYTVQATENGHTVAGSLLVSNPTSTAPLGTPSPTQESLTSQIGGYAIVPYVATYSLQQTYGSVTGGSCAPGTDCYTSDLASPPKDIVDGDATGLTCPPLLLPSSTNEQTTVLYSDALVNGHSNQLSATIEGGDSYMQEVLNNSKYFIPNVSNYNLILPPDILYNLQNDRLFGSFYANTTACQSGVPSTTWDCSANKQVILDYINWFKYQTRNYKQEQGGGYETIGVLPSFVQGAAALQGLLRGGSAYAKDLFGGQAATSTYNAIQSPYTVPLFEIYKQVVYDSNVNLSLNNPAYQANGGEFGGTYFGNLYGYQRLIYVFTDRLGNSVFFPMDTDIANTITINLDINTAIDPTNSNATTISISGLAGTYSNLGTQFTALPNNDIYLYYDTDLDLLNYDPHTDSKDVIYCAYNTPNLGAATPADCTTFNPSYTERIPSYATVYPGPVGQNAITYNPAYNSLGYCNPPPNSLLEGGFTKCNLYGGYGLSATCPYTGVLQKCELQYKAAAPPPPAGDYASLMGCISDNGYAYCMKFPQFGLFTSCVNGYDNSPPVWASGQFCMPIYSNGTGECTSQLGLFKKVTTDANGAFGTPTPISITACGSRQDFITAQYYGYPGSEPLRTKVVPLSLAANTVNRPAANPLTANELNFSQAPDTQQSAPIQIGLYLLSYNDIEIFVLIASIITALFYLLRSGARPSRRRK